MSFKQLVSPNLGITTTPGWCLKAVRQAFNAPALYPTATAGWNNAQFKHHDMNFPGCYVPIWFSLAKEPAGHVAIMSPDGSVYSTTSSTKTTFSHHANFDALIKAYAPYNPLTYLGWSEDVCSVKVVEFVPDVIKATADEVRQAYSDMLERPADDGGLLHYMNYPIGFVRDDLLKSDEYKALQERKYQEALAEQARLQEEAHLKAEAEELARVQAEQEAKRIADELAIKKVVEALPAPIFIKPSMNFFVILWNILKKLIGVRR